MTPTRMAYPRPYRRPDGGRRHANFYYFAGPTFGAVRRPGEALHPDRAPLSARSWLLDLESTLLHGSAGLSVLGRVA